MRILSLTHSYKSCLTILVGVFVLFVFNISNALAATYYVSPTGNDSNSGLSQTSAWRSISKVNSIQFKPGDKIFFEGGKTHVGSIYFNNADMGSDSQPIEVSSYGTGRAIISSGASPGLYGYNTGGFVIKNINFVGAGFPNNKREGIGFYVDAANNKRFPSLTIENVEVSGFKEGISIGSWNGTTGFDGIKITYTRAFNNAHAGITTYGYTAPGITGHAHRNLYIGYVTVHDNTGIPELTTNSGNGILLGQVDGGVIEYSVAYRNGIRNAGGPVAIWAYGSNNIIIQHNIAHHNGTTGTTDGGGFNLDGGVTNSIMQYNYSYNNDGPGYLFAQYPNAMPFANNIIRYNISENDGRKDGDGSITVWNGNGANGIRNSKIHNNTVYIEKNSSITPTAVVVIGDEAVDVEFYNNIFITKNGAQMVALYSNRPSNINAVFRQNNYWASGDTTRFVWGNNSYTSLSAWRSGTQRENHNGVATGIAVNPLITSVGAKEEISDPRQLLQMKGYRLSLGSPMIDVGINEKSVGTLPQARVDFFGTKIPQSNRYDIGAHEYSAVSTVVDTTPPSVPTNVTAKNVTDSRIELSWNEATDNVGVVGYRVFRNGSLLATTPVNAYVDDRLTSQTTYTYTIRAYDAAGNEGGGSSPLAVTTNSRNEETTVILPPTWSIGAGVQVVADAEVFSRAGTSKGSKRRGIQYPPSAGTIIGGPSVVSGETWFRIDFVTGADGWVRQNNLMLTSVAVESESRNIMQTFIASAIAAYERFVSNLK